MTESGPPRKDLVCVRGDSATIEIGPVTITDQAGTVTPVDLTIGSWQAWFTVKWKADDDDPGLWQGTEQAEITLNDPPTPAKNYMTVRIPAGTFASTDPLVAADRTTLVYDAEIDDGISRHETVVRGNLNVIADVGHA